MRSQCPGCGMLYNITPEHLGRQVPCKKCGHSFVIEAVLNEIPPPAAQPQSDPQPPSYTGQTALPEKDPAAVPEREAAIQSQCPDCGMLYHISQEHLGQNLQCQNCGHSFVIEAVGNGGPKPTSQPQSASQTQPQAPPPVDQALPMAQVTCQHCGTVNQMPPGSVCNCGRCGQPLSKSALSSQPWSAQAAPKAAAKPKTTVARTQYADTSQFVMGQILKSTFSILFKTPVIFLGLGILACIPSAFLLIKNGGKILDDSAGQAILIFTDIASYMIVQVMAAYAVFKILRQEQITIEEAHDFSRVRMGTIVMAAFLVSLIIGLGLAGFVVPGLILAVLLTVAMPVCAVERLSVMDSIKRSVELTKGYRLQIGGLYLINALLMAIGFLAVMFIFGGIFLELDAYGFLSETAIDSLFMTGSSGSTIWDAIFVIFGNLLCAAFPVAYGCVMTATLYFKLREIKEGATLDSLAGAFELNQGQ